MAGPSGASVTQTFIGRGPLWAKVVDEGDSTVAVLVAGRNTLWRRSSWQPYEYTHEMVGGKCVFTAGGSEQYPVDQPIRIGQAIALRRS